ncbi:MAG: hypothetical protein COU29_01265 [Candidatus Magasanikbacteria bacterium CG10_big_fil_rev_8_21_14_0_10_36_32]|uniref:Lactamase n=1 Tax=Candidatus Magasanikbacteria bacterium CG10_big_fil_rev_8_21_14_0_10_36_32 TaxID=1974646 RepID=A0A2M6W6H4_9BACT|nr:MAG: hypothetical protein COU29_01265 [Candidatus Magasanikbacteria bacterium CG10_big_fil_rev_8_21_14_0_10_36_32]
MHINWLGQTCVKLQSKNLKDEDVIILIDGYKPSKGDFPRSFSPNIALFSNGENNSATLSQNPLIANTLGEYEAKDTMIYALPGPDGKLIFKIITEGMTIVHLGQLNKKLNQDLINQLDNPDILLIPVGGGNYLNPEIAAEMVTTLEPRIVIPIALQCDTDPKAGTANDFIKQIGLKPEITEKKIIIKKKDLPQEETKLIILEKNY